MQIALYKAPGTIFDKLIRFVTRSQYSHCELVIDGLCYSSSPRDRGVRMKHIDLTEDKWDVFEIEGDKVWALDWFINNVNKPYDWVGAVLSVVPFGGG